MTKYSPVLKSENLSLRRKSGNETFLWKTESDGALFLCYSSQGPAVLRVFYLILNAKPAWKWRRHSCMITLQALKPCRAPVS